MSMLKRVLLSVFRQKGKTVLLLFTIIVIGTSFVSSVIIKSVLSQTNNQMYKEMNPVVVTYGNQKPMTIDTAKEIAKSQYVDYLEYNLSGSVEIQGLKSYVGGIKGKDLKMVPNGSMGFIGTNLKDIMRVKKGTDKLVEGRMFTQEEIDQGTPVAIIPKKLAELNHYTVGQKISSKIVERDKESGFKNATPDEDGMISSDKFPELFSFDTQFEIVGIVDVNENTVSTFETPNMPEEERKKMLELQKVYIQNQAIVPNNMVSKLFEEIKQQYIKRGLEKKMMNYGGITPMFVLKDAATIPQFIDEVKGKADEGTQFLSDIKEIDRAVSKTKTFATIADILFFTSIVITILVLGSLLTLFVRDRKSEIGLLSALGETKRKIGFQILIEAMLVSLLGLSIALGIGIGISQQLSKEISKTQVSTLTHERENQNGNYEPTLKDFTSQSVDMKKIDENFIINNTKSSIQVSDVALIYVIGIMSVGVASILPTVYILRLKPKKILL